MRLLIAAALLCLIAVPAAGQSSPDHGGGFYSASASQQQRSVRSPRRGRVAHHRVSHRSAAVVGHRPAGCPVRYCGCAAARYLGIPNPGGRLNLADNWRRMFPRAAAAPGMAAARPGHVYVILEVLGGGMVLAYDPNSGGGKTRIHTRSLAGFTVVNPRSTRYASAL